METAQSPVANFMFSLSLGGAEPAGFFAEANGLSNGNQVVEHTAAPEIGESLSQRFRGQVTWSNIVLRRGVDNQLALWNWRSAVLSGKVDADRKDCTINVLNQTGAVVVTYALVRAWPCKYSSPGLNASGNDILVEELELAHEGLTRTT
ncbi:MAG: conserved hypothetical phage tail protein [Conexibacter sp.]|nr:conserved hypothetical phage tail protein [Conexibacter sp.]